MNVSQRTPEQYTQALHAVRYVERVAFTLAQTGWRVGIGEYNLEDVFTFQLHKFLRLSAKNGLKTGVRRVLPRSLPSLKTRRAGEHRHVGTVNSRRATGVSSLYPVGGDL